MNQIRLVWSFVVHLKNCVLQPCPSSKMATVAKKKIQSLIDDYSVILGQNEFKWKLLLHENELRFSRFPVVD